MSIRSIFGVVNRTSTTSFTSTVMNTHLRGSSAHALNPALPLLAAKRFSSSTGTDAKSCNTFKKIKNLVYVENVLEFHKKNYLSLIRKSKTILLFPGWKYEFAQYIGISDIKNNCPYMLKYVPSLLSAGSEGNIDIVSDILQEMVTDVHIDKNFLWDVVPIFLSFVLIPATRNENLDMISLVTKKLATDPRFCKGWLERYGLLLNEAISASKADSVSFLLEEIISCNDYTNDRLNDYANDRLIGITGIYPLALGVAVAQGDAKIIAILVEAIAKDTRWPRHEPTFDLNFFSGVYVFACIRAARLGRIDIATILIRAIPKIFS